MYLNLKKRIVELKATSKHLSCDGWELSKIKKTFTGCVCVHNSQWHRAKMRMRPKNARKKKQKTKMGNKNCEDKSCTG